MTMNMNVNVNDLVAAALPPSSSSNKKKNKPHKRTSSNASNTSSRRTLAVVHDNLTAPNHHDPSFLSDDFPRDPPHVFVTADASSSADFDPFTLETWQAEGFVVEYLPFSTTSSGEKKLLSTYRSELDALSKRSWMPCQTFGIIAYGAAAAACLDYFSSNTNDRGMKLSCLVAYYPPRMPDFSTTRWPANIHVCIHLVAGTDIGIIATPQMVGIQGNHRRVVRKRRVDAGIGPAGALHGASGSRGVRVYAYDGVDVGFAERDLDEWDPACADIAWGRSLTTARRGLCGVSNGKFDLEKLVDDNQHARFITKNLDRTMATYAPNAPGAHVTYTPTLTGGVSSSEIRDFYQSYFFPTPPSLRATLVSRTVGTDRLVDELHVSFRHTQQMPWILPRVPPTKKRVEIMVVSIVAVRGGKIMHEHVYWDQASVLVQVGLLDPEVLPKKVKRMGVERLPVVGAAAAQRVVVGGDEDGNEGEADNELIYGGDEEDEEDDEDGVEEVRDEDENEDEDEVDGDKSNGVEKNDDAQDGRPLSDGNDKDAEHRGRAGHSQKASVQDIPDAGD